MKQEDDKPKSNRRSLVETWRPPGGLSEDPYTQKTVQRRVPAEILAAARKGIYGPAGEVSASDDEAVDARDEELEALDAGWDGEA